MRRDQLRVRAGLRSGEWVSDWAMRLPLIAVLALAATPLSAQSGRIALAPSVLFVQQLAPTPPDTTSTEKSASIVGHGMVGALVGGILGFGWGTVSSSARACCGDDPGLGTLELGMTGMLVGFLVGAVVGASK